MPINKHRLLRKGGGWRKKNIIARYNFKNDIFD